MLYTKFKADTIDFCLVTDFSLESKLRRLPQNLIDFYGKMFNIRAIISGRGLVEGRFHSEEDPFDRVVIRSLEQ